jgi:thymidylate synthase
MPMFEADSADQVWLQAVSAIKSAPDKPKQNGRGGRTAELLHVVLQVHDSRQRWVTSRCPGVSVAFAIVEVVGLLNGRRDSAYLNFFNPSLPKYAGTGTEYHGAYGFRLRHNAGFDQLERASQALAANPDGRQVVLQIWDPSKDFPDDRGEPVAEDIPCNICSLLKVRNGKLEWSQIMRSNDAFKGLPYNFVQFMTLQEVLAGWIGIEPGGYTHYADSLHLYEKDAEKAISCISSPVKATSDSLVLPRHEAAIVWGEMNRRVDELIRHDLSEREYRNLTVLPNAPQAFTNLMSVVVADAARRRGNPTAVDQAIRYCENPLLRKLWERWAARWEPSVSKH